MNWLKQLISDGDGAPSTMRAMSLIVVVPVMIVWTVLSIRRGDFIIPDAKIVVLVVSAITNKSLQSFAENLHTTNQQPTATPPTQP